MNSVCAKCGSVNLIPDAQVTEMTVLVQGARRIEAFDAVHSVTGLQARVCGDCGYTELTVDDPSALLQAYRKIGN